MRGELLSVLRQEVDRVLHGQDLLSRVIRNLATEFFFEGHDEFDRIKTVGAKIVDEARCVGDLVGFDTQVLDDDPFNALGNVAQSVFLDQYNCKS